MRSPKFLLALGLTLILGLAPLPAFAQNRQQSADPNTFTTNELVNSGHQFFGSVSRGLAMAVQDVTKRWGHPNAYILGQEAAGAFIGGLRYGEGTLYTRAGGKQYLFWQGPSMGFDAGGEGARTMMLVYDLRHSNSLFQRFGGVDGSAYFIGGFAISALKAEDIVIVTIRSGVGARLGVNIGYLKFTRQATWNPF